MPSPALSERAMGSLRDAPAGLRLAARPRVASALVALAALALCGCSLLPALREAPAAQSGPAGMTTPVPAPVAAASPPTASGAPAGARPSGAPGGAGGAPAAMHPQVTPAAQADFNRAVSFMRSGNATEAELGLKQVALQYPQFAAPLVNLAILQRKQGHLDQAEETLKSAVGRESGSAVAWTELGATQRMRGEFKEASSSYEQAIAANPRYAPAWRNLGVLSDLYLGDPNRALVAFEQYKQLTGEDKPVSGWIAELRQRLGMAPAKRPAAAAPEGAPGTPPAPGATPSDAPAPQQPQLLHGGDPANATSAPTAPKAGG